MSLPTTDSPTIRFPRVPRSVGWGLAAGLLAALAAGQEPVPPAGLLPDDCLLALRIDDGPRLSSALQDAQTVLVRDLPDDVKGLLVLARLGFRASLGASPEEILEVLIPDRAALGVMPQQGRLQAVLVTRMPEPAAVERARDLLLRFGDHVRHQWHEDVLVLALDPAAIDAVAQQRQAGVGRWVLRLAELTPGTLAHGAIDLARARSLTPRPRRKIGERLDGTGAFLLGALAQSLDAAKELDFSVVPSANGVSLCARLHGPAQGTTITELAPCAGQPRSLPPLPAGTLAVVSLDRSLGTLLAVPERFLGEDHTVRVQAFLSVADQLAGGGASFVDDILGALREPMHLLVLDPDPPGEDDPLLCLPAFALVAEVAEPKVERVLHRMMTALVFITNQQRKQQDRDLFRTRPVRGDEHRGTTAFLPGWRGTGAPPTEYALQPTLLFAHGHVVFASTRASALAIVDGLAGDVRREVRGDHLELRGPAVAGLIARNRRVLEAARMLDEGETREEAERFWRIIGAVIGSLGALELAIIPGDEDTAIELTVHKE